MVQAYLTIHRRDRLVAPCSSSIHSCEIQAERKRLLFQQKPGKELSPTTPWTVSLYNLYCSTRSVSDPPELPFSFCAICSFYQEVSIVSDRKPMSPV